MLENTDNQQEGAEKSTSVHGHDGDITRREFLHDAAIGAAAALLSIPHTPTMADTTDDRKAHVDAMLNAECANPFHNDPEKWLEEHEWEFAECFDTSNEPVHTVEIHCMDERVVVPIGKRPGVMVLRLAGCGILRKDQKKWIDALADRIRQLQPNWKPVTVKIHSHCNCGAAGLQYPDAPKPDDSARHAQGEMVKALQVQGIQAEYAGDSTMNDLHDHNALGVAIDLSGRLQRSPFNSFIINAPDWKKVVEDALLALKISAGDHSYGKKLPFYTFLIVEGYDPAEAALVEQALLMATQQENGQLPIRIVRKKAPQSLHQPKPKPKP